MKKRNPEPFVCLWKTSSEPNNIRVDNEPVGEIRWAVHTDLTFEDFSIYEGGFGFYRDQIPKETILPILHVKLIRISDGHLRSGYATSALRIVLARAKRKGAKIAFIKVSANCLDEYEWKRRWYEREGFVLLKPAHISFGNSRSITTNPYMWHPLTNIKSPQPRIKVMPSRQQRKLS